MARIFDHISIGKASVEFQFSSSRDSVVDNLTQKVKSIFLDFDPLMVCIL